MIQIFDVITAMLVIVDTNILHVEPRIAELILLTNSDSSSAICLIMPVSAMKLQTYARAAKPILVGWV